MSIIGAKIGYGASVGISDDVDTPASWTTLIGVQDFEYDFGARERIDVTHHASPNFTRETVLGLKDSREISITFLYVPGNATDVLLKSLHSSGEARQIRFGDGEATPNYDIFVGKVVNYAKALPVSGPRTATVTLLLDAEVVEE